MTGTALETGATDGIGRAAALELARCGYTVHALGRDARRGAEILRDEACMENGAA